MINHRAYKHPVIIGGNERACDHQSFGDMGTIHFTVIILSVQKEEKEKFNFRLSQMFDLAYSLC